MSIQTKYQAGATFPPFSWQSSDGGDIAPCVGDGWRLLVIYRGKHCPLCRKYLAELDAMQQAFAKAGVMIWALSSDPLDRAQSEVRDEGWSLTILAGLTEEQMRELGLYISSPRTPDETDRNFAEPAIFVINPDGNVQIVDVSKAPFSRPDLKGLLDGIRFVKSKDYPVRGTVG